MRGINFFKYLIASEVCSFYILIAAGLVLTIDATIGRIAKDPCVERYLKHIIFVYRVLDSYWKC